MSLPEDRAIEFNRLYHEATEAQQTGNSAAGSLFANAARFAPDLWCDLASKLSPVNEELALKHFNQAIAVTDVSAYRASALNEIGRIFANRGQNVESIEYFNKARNLNPNHPGIMTNLGLVNRWSGDLIAADRWLNRALKANPFEHAAQLEASFVHMLSGDYLKGFAEYEARWRFASGTLKKIECAKPEWNGEEIRGECVPRHVFVYGEQGSGDVFLMLRYSKLIRSLGMRQTWVVHAAMRSLVERIKEIDCVMVPGQMSPDFDCHIPAASLPFIFKTTLATIPCGAIIPKVEPRSYGPGFHVGIAWRGSRAQANDAIRSTNLDQWKPVLSVPGVVFHSLQVDGSEEGLVYPEIQTEANSTDWMETATRMCGLNLIITVDTSAMHAAGSLGLPCWCALHCRPYFVFPLTREDCPWYPSVRLFKQKKEFEWQPVFESIAKELCKLSSHHST